MKSFTEKVYAVVRCIPRGQTLTYAEVARRAGSSRAARAVGNIMHHNQPKITGVPCHRVIRSDGTPGGYAHGTRAKVTLLKKEGAIK